MSWNIRLWQLKTKTGETYLEAKETYYNSKGEICACTENPVNICGDSVEDILEYLELLKRDIERSKEDILVDDGFIFAPWSHEESFPVDLTELGLDNA
jgi:hypothetical protein